MLSVLRGRSILGINFKCCSVVLCWGGCGALFAVGVDRGWLAAGVSDHFDAGGCGRYLAATSPNSNGREWLSPVG